MAPLGSIEIPREVADAASLDLDAILLLCDLHPDATPVDMGAHGLCCPVCLDAEEAALIAEGVLLRPTRHPRTCPYCDGRGTGPEYGHEHGDRLWCDACGGSGYEPVEPEPEGHDLHPADWLSAPCGVLLASLAAARRYPELCRIVGMALARGVARGPVCVVTSGVEIKEVA